MKIAIIRAGLAGCAAAVTLASPGTLPLLLERSRETGDALCGGFLSWSSLDRLRRLGVDPEALNPSRLTNVRLHRPRGRPVEAALPGEARGVSRRTLDAALLERAVAAGVAVERGVNVRAAEGSTLRLADGAVMQPETLFLGSGKHDIRGVAGPAPPSEPTRRSGLGCG